MEFDFCNMLFISNQIRFCKSKKTKKFNKWTRHKKSIKKRNVRALLNEEFPRKNQDEIEWNEGQ